MIWHHLDAFLTRIRPRREPLALAIDGIVVAICWNLTYLFRLGFERWWRARPDYDPWVMLGIVALYLVVFAVAKVPHGMWRFSGFGEIKRLTVACLVAGLLAAVVVLMARLVEIPRAVLALQPFITLMGVAGVRIAYRMLYEHMRARIAGHAVEMRRALVLGAGNAARLLLAGIQHEGWVVVGLLDDDPVKQRSRIGGGPIHGPLDSGREAAATQGITNVATMVCSADDLPFADATFDSVSVRFGYMFFPDMARATAEFARVLEPGGRLCSSVWIKPEENPWTAISQN